MANHENRSGLSFLVGERKVNLLSISPFLDFGGWGACVEIQCAETSQTDSFEIYADRTFGRGPTRIKGEIHVPQALWTVTDILAPAAAERAG